MTLVPERLSRISALRPVRVFENRADVVKSQNSEKLALLLGGECVRNALGGHIRVQCRQPEPKPRNVGLNALRLVSSDPPDLACDFRQWLFLDTETTGLAGGTGTYAFLVGLAWWEGDEFVVEQRFMRDYADEASLLIEIGDHLARRRVLVTFNGKSFDWPLLQTRFQISRSAPVPVPAAHLDLLYPARQLWRLDLRSVALTQLEQHVLRLERGPDIPSHTIPGRYFDFIRGGPPEPVAEVFRHNRMDLCGLAQLWLRIAALLADPEKSACGAGELFGISRMLQRHGDEQRAGRICRKALDLGLPKVAERAARRELAFLAKRERNFELSNALWEKLLDDSDEGLKAYEQLAIYYEHRAGLLQKAAELSREALLRLQNAFHSGQIPLRKYEQWHCSFHHRLDRLAGKMNKSRERGFIDAGIL